MVKKVSSKKGGEGAFRDFVEELLMDSGTWEEVIKHWTNK
jgi:3-deoxy-D-manno-octulosonate 8-phosphate phosphatase KdsC-like HAD superfamily phosphatase